jgi:hypothetical protein
MVFVEISTLNIGELSSKIHSLAKVLSTKYLDNTMQISYKANRENAEKITKLIHSIK